MNILLEDGEVVFGELDEFLGNLIQRLPECAESESEAARKRLFGPPTAGRDPEADEDWREVVEPEMRELFQSHIDIVTEDLQGLEKHDGEHVLRVPVEHLPAWVHTLNQARLALGAEYDVTEEDMSGHNLLLTDQSKGFALLQIEVYGLILGVLLRHMEE